MKASKRCSLIWVLISIKTWTSAEALSDIMLTAAPLLSRTCVSTTNICWKKVCLCDSVYVGLPWIYGYYNCFISKRTILYFCDSYCYNYVHCFPSLQLRLSKCNSVCLPTVTVDGVIATMSLWSCLYLFRCIREGIESTSNLRCSEGFGPGSTQQDENYVGLMCCHHWHTYWCYYLHSSRCAGCLAQDLIVYYTDRVWLYSAGPRVPTVRKKKTQAKIRTLIWLADIYLPRVLV